MTLYLLPNFLSDELSTHTAFPPIVSETIPTLDGLIAESEKGGRHYLRRFSKHLPIRTLNEHTTDLTMLLEPLKKGERWGLISDAGLPCVADPGARFVFLCRQENIPVEAMIGPSSLFLILMLSGLDSQRFTFHGYLPREKSLLIDQLKKLEKDKTSHVFIEAPYRNSQLFQTLREVLSPSTYLCVAWNLMSPNQGVLTAPIHKWRTSAIPPIEKVPTIFQLKGH